jgi:hypothetical protein
MRTVHNVKSNHTTFTRTLPLELAFMRRPIEVEHLHVRRAVLTSIEAVSYMTALVKSQRGAIPVFHVFHR